jgi:pimeloyl-ACP methyl ester carboxylesterase
MRLLLAALLLGGAARDPVRAVGDQRLAVGAGVIPLFATRDLARPAPGITRAVVVVHGLNRDADTYFAAGVAAQKEAGAGAALIIAPQFLADVDAAAHHLPDGMPRWGRNDWAGGEPALGPAKLSAFDALDAILARLADRSLFPDLKMVVVAGHSAGAQLVQRYAVVNDGQSMLDREGIAVRYIIANPSSYLYFSPDRPRPDPSCAGYNEWRYGFASGVPPDVPNDPGMLERRYVMRDVVYLLGTADTNPKQSVLDKSCAAETQGAYRYIRGHNYVDYIRGRNGATQLVHDIPGVGHDGPRMLNSVCGLAALFDTPGCPAEVTP